MNSYNVVNFYDEIEFSVTKIMIKKILETDTYKEIRICLSKEQHMKEHTAPGAITVMVLEGKIIFNIGEEEYILTKGSMINLGAHISHSLFGVEDSVIRLSLTK